MSRNRPQRDPLHDFQAAEIVVLTATVDRLPARTVAQVIGFRGRRKVRILPLCGVPVAVGFEVLERTGLIGEEKPPTPFRRRRRPRPAAAAA